MLQYVQYPIFFVWEVSSFPCSSKFTAFNSQWTCKSIACKNSLLILGKNKAILKPNQMTVFNFNKEMLIIRTNYNKKNVWKGNCFVHLCNTTNLPTSHGLTLLQYDATIFNNFSSLLTKSIQHRLGSTQSNAFSPFQLSLKNF